MNPQGIYKYIYISIHALREEGDLVIQPFGQTLEDFYPRPPRGGRRKQIDEDKEIYEFLSTPSARRATSAEALEELEMTNFYPRPPRGGRLMCARVHVSIR